jgi:16S rRNA processing protein RimM
LDNEPELFENLISVVEQQTLGSSFFIEKLTPQNDFLRVRFEDVSNEEEADAILGNNLYLPIKCCPNLAVTNSIFTK